MSTDSVFNSQYIISQLNSNSNTFKNLLGGITNEAYLWKPAPDKWCLLEIVCHLYDEEREDFRARLNHVLTIPDLQLPSVDPFALVISHDYFNKDYNEMLQRVL